MSSNFQGKKFLKKVYDNIFEGSVNHLIVFVCTLLFVGLNVALMRKEGEVKEYFGMTVSNPVPISKPEPHECPPYNLTSPRSFEAERFPEFRTDLSANCLDLCEYRDYVEQGFYVWLYLRIMTSHKKFTKKTTCCGLHKKT